MYLSYEIKKVAIVLLWHTHAYFDDKTSNNAIRQGELYKQSGIEKVYQFKNQNTPTLKITSQ